MWIRATDSAFSHPVAADGGHPHNDAVAATKATRADGFNCETAHSTVCPIPVLSANPQAP
jgi:hypothetical protein